MHVRPISWSGCITMIIQNIFHYTKITVVRECAFGQDFANLTGGRIDLEAFRAGSRLLVELLVHTGYNIIITHVVACSS